MHRHDDFGMACYCALDQARIYIEAGWINIYKHGLCTESNDRSYRSKETKRGCYYFVAGTYATGHQCQLNCIGARGASHRFGALAVRCDLFFEFFYVGTENELLTVQHPLYCLINLS